MGLGVPILKSTAYKYKIDQQIQAWTKLYQTPIIRTQESVVLGRILFMMVGRVALTTCIRQLIRSRYQKTLDPVLI